VNAARDTTLVAAAHGTRSTLGRRQLESLVDMVRAHRPGLDGRLCYMDVLAPSLADIVTALDGAAVVVPVLLSAGYHVNEDIPSVVGDRAVVARQLGPDPVLTDVLVRRLREAHALPVDVVALVASASSARAAYSDIAAAGAQLANSVGVPVEVLTIGDELPSRLAAFAARGRLAIATYLLAEGHFADVIRRAAPPDVPVSEPFGADPAVADLVLRRFDEAMLG
jgi:sirohydrochlorin ferrochelatase